MPELKKDPFEEYIRQAEGDRRDRGYAWQTAIGLQDVDGIRPSAYLLQAARRNIEGEITMDGVEALLDTYYRENAAHLPNDRTEEADRVSARIAALLSENAFVFAPSQYISIHKCLFDGIYPYAGKIRDYNITKHEWVLDGRSVIYGSAYNLREMLEYDFAEEKRFSYKGRSSDEIIAHIADFISRLWQIHAFGEGNTRTTAVFSIKYLKTLGFEVTNDAFAANAWYFRNALVRANYNDLKNGIHETTQYLELFLRNLLLNEDNVLRNRDLHVRGLLSEEKQDIGGEKQDIDFSNVLKNAGLSAHTRANVEKLLLAFGSETVFGRTDAAKILGITASPASALIKRMLDAAVIVPVKGQGKGKYRFCV